MSTVQFARARTAPFQSDKPLPHNADAERNVLGGILLDASNPNATLKAVMQQINGADFYVPEHSAIWRRMLAIAEKKLPIDLMVLTDELQTAGELERIPGGAGYVAKLIDGLPAGSNVGEAVRIVREHSVRRQLILKHNEHLQRALEGAEAPETLLHEFEDFSRSTIVGRKSSLVRVNITDFLMMKFDPLEFIIEPLLPLRGSGMIYSPPGLGKTHISLYMAFCIAVGAPSCFVWDIPKKRRILYVDGEMDAESLQEMVRQIAMGHEMEIPDPDFFGVVNPDFQKGTTPRINTFEGRRAIEELLHPGDILFLDNLSTLCPGADEDETENWSKVQEWILDLRRKGIATFLVHHANKSGLSQLGTSKKEHQLSVNLKLRRPSNYEMAEGLRVEVLFDKLRSRGSGEFKPQWAQPFEVMLKVEDGRAVFLHRPLTKILKERAKEYLTGGMKEHDVVLETGLSRWVVRRIAQDIKWGERSEKPSED